jgi:hypothetical protein
MRNKIWDWIREGTPAGAILPGWKIILGKILFPGRFLKWKLEKSIGYQIETDTWKIYGIEWSDGFFRAFANPDGCLFRVKKENGRIVIERIREADTIIIPRNKNAQSRED